MRIFLDSSALAKRYIDEQGSDLVENLCTDASELGISTICIPEVISALNRLVRENLILHSQYILSRSALFDDLNDIFVCQINNVIIGKSVQLLEKNPLRAMDALHLACALEWQPERFVSSDVRQLSAAHLEGLATERV